MLLMWRLKYYLYVLETVLVLLLVESNWEGNTQRKKCFTESLGSNVLPMKKLRTQSDSRD